MNYSRIYQCLMDSAKARERGPLLERHHVIPKCLGGSDGHSNIVNLSPREHYIAHLLLCHMHPSVHGLKLAVILMSGRCKMRKSRAYDAIRRAAMEERRRRLKGKKRPNEHMEAMWASTRGKDRPKYHCDAISRGKTGKKLSEYHRRRISEAGKGKKLSDDHVLKAAKGQSSLPDSVIQSMRKEFDSGGIQDHISRKHGVSLSLGSRIMKRKSYKWVPEEPMTGEGVRLDQ